ncbi:MAG: rhodanese-like domain-containing protein [Bacteroidota bacterium]|nr:rhodanese-like domain-containing protein [Bacteroidota bacterium]
MGFFSNLFKSNTSSINLTELINEGGFLVDVRSPLEFKSGSVKGAVNIPLDQISQQIKKFENKKNIIVFCRSGNRSGQAKRILEQQGFKNVTNGGTWENVKKYKH